MDNIYEYGSEKIQKEPNYVYKSFKELMKESGVDKGCLVYKKEQNEAKIIGAITAEVFRKNIEYVLKKNMLSDMYKVSDNNVYVKDCYIEFDFLILNKGAKKILNHHVYDSGITMELPMYDIDDVIAVLESKTYGIYSLYKGRTENTKNEMEKNKLYRFVSAYKDTLHGMKKNIKIGYMCMAEQRPNTGNSNFIENNVFF